jgi:hypothetical protein
MGESVHPASLWRPFLPGGSGENPHLATEVVSALGKKENALPDHLRNANAEANPELFGITLKMATGSGKTPSWP